MGGVRVRSQSGNVRLQNTLYGRLESAREELTSEVSKILFGSASPEINMGAKTNTQGNSTNDSKVVSKPDAESAPDASAEV